MFDITPLPALAVFLLVVAVVANELLKKAGGYYKNRCPRCGQYLRK